MSDFTVLGDVGNTLKRLLEDDPWTGILPKPEVTFKSPREIKDEAGSANRVSLFLYQISENAHLRNDESLTADDLQFPPQVLDLLYLITPYSDDKTQEKYMLGKVMQIFGDNAVLTGTVLQGGLAGSTEEIRVVFHPASLEELTKIWTAFQDVAYRLSVCYLVTPVKIDSTRHAAGQRVLSREMDHAVAVRR